MPRIFLDTEFTNFMSPALLSLGLVADAMEIEMYAELDMASEAGRRRSKASTEFVHGAVLPQWGRIAYAECSEYEMGARAGRWLKKLLAECVPGTRIEVVFDSPTDAELLASALKVSGMFDELEPIIDWLNVAYLDSDRAAQAAQEASWARTFALDRLERHHALADARALRAGFRAVRGAYPAGASAG